MHDGRRPAAAAGDATARRRSGAWVQHAAALLAFGVLGGLLSWRAAARRAGRPAPCSACRARRGRNRAMVGAVAAVHVGLAAVALAAFPGIETCRPLAGWRQDAQEAFLRPPGGVWPEARAAVAAGPSGAALVYGELRDARTCRAAGNGAIVSMADSGFPRAGVMLGAVYVTDAKPRAAYSTIAASRRHEGRHIDQWAVSVPLGGPLAFPLAYAVVEALSPGEHNHFERMAGLSDGGYAVPDGPGPTSQRATVAGVAVLAAVLGRRRVAHAAAVLRRAAVPPPRDGPGRAPWAPGRLAAAARALPYWAWCPECAARAGLATARRGHAVPATADTT